MSFSRLIKLLLVTVFGLQLGWGQATSGFHRVSQVFGRAGQSVTAQVVPFAKISVITTATGTSAAIYSDPLLTSLISPSVVTADKNGNYDYYIANNYCVTETISAPGQGTYTIPNVCSASGVATSIDLSQFGIICDGAYHASNDTILDSTVLPLWTKGGVVLTGPTGGKCWFQNGHTATIAASQLGKMVLDLRGGTWQFGASSGTDFHIVNGNPGGGPGIFSGSGITLTNGTLTDAGNGASVLVDVDGSPYANTGMSKVWIDNLNMVVSTQTTTAFQTESTFQSGCIDSEVYMPYGSLSSSVLGYYGYNIRPKSGSGQDTGDWTLYRCESFGFDHGLNANGVNEVKVFSGTYLLSYEENVLISGTGSASSVHVENGWLNNPSGATYRAGLACVGSCFIRDIFGADSLGSMNSVVRLFSGSGANSTISGGQAFNSYTAYAYLGGTSSNEIDVMGIPIFSTITSGTYTSGGSITGSAAQTCSLTFASGATATVALTGTNVIAPGTSLTIVAGGSQYGPPVSATLSNGTATCSGTAVVTTTLTPTGSPAYLINSGTPNIIVTTGAYYVNQVAPQFIYSINNPTANSGYSAWGHDNALNSNPEQFFFRRYGPTSFNMGGIRLADFQTWAFDNCLDATGSSSFTTIPYANCPASGSGSGGFNVKSSTSLRQTIDVSGMNNGAENVKPDPNGGVMPALPSGFTVATNGIPRFSGTAGHFSGTEYDSSNQIPANFVPTFGTGAAGVVPASGGGTSNFLRADGTWNSPPNSGAVVGSTDSTGLTANAVGGTMFTLGGSPTQTYFEVCISEVETTAAGVSSTLPSPVVKWTDAETSTVISQSLILAGTSATANTIGTVLSACTQIHAAASTVIQAVSGGYASNPANVMAYSIHGTVVSLR
jgi:hypothetical protein